MYGGCLLCPLYPLLSQVNPRTYKEEGGGGGGAKGGGGGWQGQVRIEDVVPSAPGLAEGHKVAYTEAQLNKKRENHE